MNIISISDFRNKAADFISQAADLQKTFTIMQRSKPKAVLVNHDYYQALEQAVIDLTDAREADKAKKEPTIKFSSYLKKRWPTKWRY